MSFKKDIKQPLVSVIMPAYNAGKYVGKTIESILNQTYQNFELVIVDDGSTNGTVELLQSYQKRYPKKIKLYRFDKNRGESFSANYAFKNAQGEFIARMDADDIAKPDRLATQVVFLLKNPRVIVVGSQAEVIDRNGVVIGKKFFPVTHDKIYEKYAILHPMLHSSCMIRRSLLPNDESLYEDIYEPNDDYYTFFRLLCYGNFANINKPLVQYRVHGQNKSLTNPKSKFFNSVKIRLAAIRNGWYKPTRFVYIVMIVQIIAITIMPEKLIVPVYTFLRGMHSPKIIKKRLNFKKLTKSLQDMRFFFSRIKILPRFIGIFALGYKIKNITVFLFKK